MARPLKFKDYPEFTPNLTPKQILLMGSFGGGYFRDIYSSVTKKFYKDYYKKYPQEWFRNLPKSMYASENYDVNINFYKKRSGATLGKNDPFGLKYWESKNWIKSQNPYGWFEWYCDFYLGKRTLDDKRQIKRWLAFAGPNGRFKIRLLNQIKKKGANFNDYSISPAIRQGLQHWAYQITPEDIS